MANRRRSAIVVGFFVPALACTAVTGLGKSYEYVDDGGGRADGSIDSASGSDGGVGADGAKDDGQTGAQCPALITGGYSMSSQGDCGNTFDHNAAECIGTTTTTLSSNCAIQFVTTGAGVKGTLDAQSDGVTFKSGVLTIGSAKHAGCTATWKPVPLPPTVTVSCPPDAGLSACVVTMTREGTCL